MHSAMTLWMDGMALGNYESLFATHPSLRLALRLALAVSASDWLKRFAVFDVDQERACVRNFPERK